MWYDKAGICAVRIGRKDSKSHGEKVVAYLSHICSMLQSQLLGRCNPKHRRRGAVCVHGRLGWRREDPFGGGNARGAAMEGLGETSQESWE